MLDAARVGVLVMAGVTSLVLLLFGRFFLRISKKGDSPLFPDQKGDSPLFLHDKGAG